MSKTQLGVIFGSRSCEREVAIISAVQLMNHVNVEAYDVIPVYISEQGVWYTGAPLRKIETFRHFNPDAPGIERVELDMTAGSGALLATRPGKGLFGHPTRVMVARLEVCLVVMHGLNGEDGTLQGMLELANLPYTSTGVAGSAIGMDKIMMKQFFRGAGLPVLPGAWFTRSRWEAAREQVLDEAEAQLGYPVFVKPANLGSSIGVSRADHREGLADSLDLSQVNLDMVLSLSSPVVSIALLAMIESLLCGASASRMKDEPFDANRELIAQGVGNILLPFFGGVPATAAIARTSVAIKSGEQTRLTGLFHSLFLLLSMLLLGGVMARLPLSALAGVLMVTAWRMNEWHGIRTIFSRRIWTGIMQFSITMISTVVFDLTVAIVIGIVTALLMFVWNAARLRVEIAPVEHERLVRLTRMGAEVTDEQASGIQIAYINGSMFFANCGELKHRLEDADYAGCERLILSMRGVAAADISGVQTLMEVCQRLSQRGLAVSVCGVQQNVRPFFDKVGLSEQMGKAAFYANASEALIDAVAQEAAER